MNAGFFRSAGIPCRSADRIYDSGYVSGQYDFWMDVDLDRNVYEIK